MPLEEEPLKIITDIKVKKLGSNAKVLYNVDYIKEWFGRNCVYF